MRVIIAGSRTITDSRLVAPAIKKSGFVISTVVCGGAKGVDTLGHMWAKQNNVKVDLYPAQWDKYGKGAGYIRNMKMAENADALLLIWDGKSNGSAHMRKIAHEAGLKIHEVIV